MVFLNCAVESYGDVNGNRMIRPKTDRPPNRPFLNSLNFTMLLLAWAESSVPERVQANYMGRSICPDVGRYLRLAYYQYILVLLLNHYSGNVVICGIWLVS